MWEDILKMGISERGQVVKDGVDELLQKIYTAVKQVNSDKANLGTRMANENRMAMGKWGLEEFQGLQVDIQDEIKSRWDYLNRMASDLRIEIRNQGQRHRNIYGDELSSILNNYFKVLGRNVEDFILMVVQNAGVKSATKIEMNNEGFRVS